MGILMIRKDCFSVEQIKSLAAGGQKLWIMVNIFTFCSGFCGHFSHYSKILYKWKWKRSIFESFCCKLCASSNFELYDAIFHCQHYYMVYLSEPQRDRCTCTIKIKINLVKVCQILTIIHRNAFATSAEFDTMFATQTTTTQWFVTLQC